MGGQKEERGDWIGRRASRSIKRPNPPGVAAPQHVVLDHAGGVIAGNPDDEQKPVAGGHVEPEVYQLQKAFLLVESRVEQGDGPLPGCG